MRVSILVKDYSKLSDTALAFSAQAVIVSLTGNAYFPVTSPTLANFGTLVTAYFEAMEGTVEGGKTAIALKNQVRGELLESMRLLATNIESLAEGVRVKLVSSGFDLAADGENVQPLTTPANFRLLEGLNPGEIVSVVKGTPNAMTYLHQYTLGPVTENSQWISKASTRRELVFSGLPVGERIHARVAAIGRKGQEAYTNILSRLISGCQGAMQSCCLICRIIARLALGL